MCTRGACYGQAGTWLSEKSDTNGTRLVVLSLLLLLAGGNQACWWRLLAAVQTQTRSNQNKPNECVHL